MEVQKISGYRLGSTYFTCEANSGFFYSINSSKNGVIYLKCIIKDCPARARCTDTLFVNVNVDGHNHLEDLTKKSTLILKNEMIKNAASTSNQIRSIFIEDSANATVEAASRLAFPAMSRSMRRQRQKVQPATPHSIAEFGTTCQGNPRFGFLDEKPFCRGVVGEGDAQSVLFLAEDLKETLASSKELHIDGTFKTRPKFPKSSQLLTIIAIKYGIAFPCAFAVMGKKTKACYNGVFRALKQLIPTLNPKLILTDYEAALVRSLEENFEDASKSGCYYHYCQAVVRRASRLQMKPLLKNNLIARKAFKYLLCIPLLPADRFIDGKLYVTNFLRVNRLEDEFELLMKYYDSQWTRRVGPNSVSVFGRTRRTNNDSESFHAALLRYIRVRGPNTWEFTDCLRNITKTVVRELRAFVDEGLQIKCLGKRKYRLQDTRIRQATRLFVENGEINEFFDVVCRTATGMVDRALAEEDEEFEPNEEELVVRLSGDLPPEYSTVGDSAETEDDDDDEDEEPAQAAVETTNQPPVPAAIPRPYPQLGLVYDPIDEEIFHLPEDDYEPVPLEAFGAAPLENALEENPFTAIGYDEEMDDTLSSEEACPICAGRRKSYVLQNCGHLLCGYCTTQAYNPNDPMARCPVCRTFILNAPIRIFF